MHTSRPILSFALLISLIVAGGALWPEQGLREDDIIRVPSSYSPGTRAELAVTGRLTLAQASVEALESLPSIGPITAAAIVGYRDAGYSLDQPANLLHISGFGYKTLQRIQPFLQ